MSFVQVIEFHTADIEAIRKVDEQWRRDTEGKRTVRREILARDRNQPDRYVVIVFFDSPEAAAENSRLPETHAAAQRYRALSDGPPVFSDLDVLQDRA
jgi:quinol monooxygenase YgiN